MTASVLPVSFLRMTRSHRRNAPALLLALLSTLVALLLLSAASIMGASGATAHMQWAAAAIAPAHGAQAGAAQGTPDRVLVLLDGAEALRPPDYGYTGDWIPHLQQTGYDVIARDPGGLPAGGLRFEDFALIIIAFPATLPDNVLEEVQRAWQQSHMPVLVAAPTYAVPLGLGQIWDPTNPLRTVYGTTVDLDPNARAIVGDALQGTITLAGGPGLEDVPYQHTLYRTPIIPLGTPLGWITDEAGQRQAVWAVSPEGTRLYFGLWWSADGRNHNATYWKLFDASVRSLIDTAQAPPPTTTPALPPTPTPTPTVESGGLTATPTPLPAVPPLILPRTGDGSLASPL